MQNQTKRLTTKLRFWLNSISLPSGELPLEFIEGDGAFAFCGCYVFLQVGSHLQHAVQDLRVEHVIWDSLSFASVGSYRLLGVQNAAVLNVISCLFLFLITYHSHHVNGIPLDVLLIP